MNFTEWLNNLLKDQKINICILGDTVTKDKFAYQIKQDFLNKGYQNLYCVDKEILSLDQVPNKIDLLVLCMNPLKEIKLLTAAKNQFLNVLIQPGADSEEIEQYFNSNHITHYNGCILKHWNLISEH